MLEAVTFNRIGCERAILAFEERRRSLICDRALQIAGIAEDDLDRFLRIGTGTTGFDTQDQTLHEFICARAEYVTITFEDAGLLSSGYELTVASIRDPKSSAIMRLVESDDGGLEPRSIEHSFGGDMADLDEQTRMRCVGNPEMARCSRER